MTIVVAGAGAFGVWTAWHLARAGHAVTLVDVDAPGHPRSSSGGETRIIRMGYGKREIYTRMSMRSLAPWRELSARADRPLFVETGFLWMAHDEDALSMSTIATLERCEVPHERLTCAQMESRWPQISFDRIAWGIHEPTSGVLMSRRAVDAVAREAVRAGAVLRTGKVAPPSGRGRLGALVTESGERFPADAFVFACGSWLPKLFPDVLGGRIFVTRQEVHYFAPPPADARFAPPALPTWIDFNDEIYGMPDIESRGFKMAIDRHGPAFDPDSGDRTQVATLPEVRRLLAMRFPALAGAPHVGFEVCQYENTSNGDLLVDRHPAFENVVLVGGGSGHGFKHGPAVGEIAARLVVDGGGVDPHFRLDGKETLQERTVF
jgi:monomeric sarcosine oxidase